jgi:cobalt-zinc-cadmium efflux system outer membrane protein
MFTVLKLIPRVATLAGVLLLASTFAGAEEGPAPLGPEDTSPILTLSEALSQSLRLSPALAVFAWDLRVADAMITQAGLRANPELSMEIEGVRWNEGPSELSQSISVSGSPPDSREVEKMQGTHSGFRESEFTLSIAQPIQLGKQRAKRVAVASRSKELVLWDYQAARANVLAQTASDFIQLLAAQEHVLLEAELVTLAEEVVRAFSIRAKAGQVSPLELSRAEISLATIRIAFDESRQELEGARSALASNWGGQGTPPGRVVGHLDDIHEIPAFADLEAQVRRNPDVARWSTELAARQAEYTLQRSERLPDLTISLGLRSSGLADHSGSRYGLGPAGAADWTRIESGYDGDRDNSLVLGFSLPLPVFNRNQGRIAAAEAKISKVSAQRRHVEAMVYADLKRAHQAAFSAYTKARALREEVMPKIEITFSKMQRGYEQGKFSYLEVLDTQRTLFESRETFLSTLTRYHQGVVLLERLTGETLKTYGPTAEPDMENSNHEE